MLRTYVRTYARSKGEHAVQVRTSEPQIGITTRAPATPGKDHDSDGVGDAYYYFVLALTHVTHIRRIGEDHLMNGLSYHVWLHTY